VLIGSLRSLRQLVSLALVHPGHDLAAQQVHGEHTQHGDSFKDHSSQMSDGQDGSEGRADLDDLVPDRGGQPNDHVHKQQGLSVDDLWELGRKQEAWAQVRELLKADPQEKNLWLASVHTLLLADAGQGREAEKRINEKILKQAQELKPYGHFHHVANLVAVIYAQLNKPEQAVAWLERTAATGFPCYPSFEHGHSLDPIRRDPRFVAFMKKLKPQWEYFKSAYGSATTARSPGNQ